MKILFLFVMVFSLSACGLFSKRESSSAPDSNKNFEAPIEDVSSQDKALDTATKEDSGVPIKESDPYRQIPAFTDDIQAEEVDLQKALEESPSSSEDLYKRSSESKEQDQFSNPPSYIDQKYSIKEGSQKNDLPPLTGIDPNTSLKWLKNGNRRFLRPALRADGQSKKDIERLAHSQKPHAIVFSSSDSRIPPEIIFDEKLGEIFVIRNFGLGVDSSVLNSLEYAVKNLGIRLLVVMDRSYPRNKNIQPDFNYGREITDKILNQSLILKNYFDSKELQIIQAVYMLDTGKVEFIK